MNRQRSAARRSIQANFARMWASLLLRFTRDDRRVRFDDAGPVVPATPLARARLATELPTPDEFEQMYAEKQAALVDESLDGLERTVEWLLDLLDQSAPDEALKPAVGVLVGLLNHDGEAAVIEKAAYALRLVANRGTHGDTVREAGGVPALVSVLRFGVDTWAAEQAAGALMHLCMQRQANKEALRAAGGIAALSELLLAGPRNQAAEYAANTLGVLAMTSEVPLTTRAVHSAVVTTLEREELSEFPELQHILTGEGGDDDDAAAHDAPPPPSASADGASCVDTPSSMRMRLAQLASTLYARLPAFGFSDGSTATQVRTAVQEDDESYWTCPITHELFRDPVIASDGMTYEHSAIRNVLETGNGLSPLTREPLASALYPNFSLRQHIAAHRAADGGGGERGGPPLRASAVPRQSGASLCLAASAGALAAIGFALALDPVRQAWCA